MSIEKRALGEAVRLARMKKALTQERLAEMLDITPIHLKNIEGSRRIPSVPLLFRMMELLDFSVGRAGIPGAGEGSGDSHRRADGAGSGGTGPAGGRDESKGIAAACVDARAAAVHS